MALDDLKILTKIEELDEYGHIVLRQYPRIERYALAQDIRDTMSEIEHLTIRCAKKYHKKTSLQDLDIEVEYLRGLIRKSYSLQYINVHRYEVWSRRIDEVGRMIGGWMKTFK